MALYYNELECSYAQCLQKRKTVYFYIHKDVMFVCQQDISKSCE